MQMVRQHDDRRDFERILPLRFFERASQRVDLIDEQGLPPFQQIVREEPASAGNKGAAIVRHARSVTIFSRRNTPCRAD
jgi:hypothetical protein